MNVGFAALDMIVQIIAKQMNQIDGIVPYIFVGVPWEQNWIKR